jgi:hypothetical protein
MIMPNKRLSHSRKPPTKIIIDKIFHNIESLPNKNNKGVEKIDSFTFDENPSSVKK